MYPWPESHQCIYFSLLIFLISHFCILHFLLSQCYFPTFVSAEKSFNNFLADLTDIVALVYIVFHHCLIVSVILCISFPVSMLCYIQFPRFMLFLLTITKCQCYFYTIVVNLSLSWLVRCHIYTSFLHTGHIFKNMNWFQQKYAALVLGVHVYSPFM
jgi:hypothetical protein